MHPPLFRSVDVYVAGVVALGLFVATLAIVATPTVVTEPVLLLAIACGATQLVRVALPRASSVSPAVAVSFVALVWLGLGAAVIVLVAGALVDAVARRQAPRKAVFNAAVWVLAAAAATSAYRVLGPPLPNRYLADAVIAVVSAGAYFAANTSLVTGAISLSGGQPFWGVWFDNYLGVAPSYILMAIIGIGGGVAAETGGLMALGATAGLVLLPWLSVVLYVSKAREASRALARLAEQAECRLQPGPGAVV